MKPKKLVLYYFTGTGNSYRVANWMAESARQQGLDVRLAAVNEVRPEAEPASDAETLVGLLSPTHAFTAPWWMIRFASRLPRSRGAGAFVLLTRGSMKYGRVITPGLEGSGAYLLALILRLKGYHVRGVTGLDMPSNWTVIHPGQSHEEAEAIVERSQPRAMAFLAHLLEGKTAFKGGLELILGLALLPVSVLYLLVGHFLLAKLFYASDRCNGCGLCARSCPVQGIRMQGKSNPRPYWTFLCESCTRCINFCPRQAVEASYPLGVAAVYLSNVPIAALLLDTLARQAAGAAGLKGTWVEWVIAYPYKLLSFAAAYGVFSLLMRLPAFNRLLTRLTPTHYYRRYTAAGTSLKDLQTNIGKRE